VVCRRPFAWQVPFVFGDQFELSNEVERRLSAKMGCGWRNFVHTGDPSEGPGGGCGGLEWPPVSHVAAKQRTLVFSTEEIRLERALKQTHCNTLRPAAALAPPSQPPPRSLPAAAVAALVSLPIVVLAAACALVPLWRRRRREWRAAANSGMERRSSCPRRSLLRLSQSSTVLAETRHERFEDVDVRAEPMAISEERALGPDAPASTDGTYAPPLPEGGAREREVVASPLMAQPQELSDLVTDQSL
jgi:hypothetical protein